MQIDNTAFGKITIDGKTYEHDYHSALRRGRETEEELSKKLYGTSHVVSKDEAKFVFEKGCRRLILGSGQEGNVRLSPEAEVLLCQEAVRGHNSADTASDSRFQRSTRKEDRSVPCDLLTCFSRLGLPTT